MIKINVPDDVEDPKDFYKKEWQRLYYQLNKERYKTRKRVRTLKKYCGLLNRDIDEYLKNDPSYDEIKLINENLIREYHKQKYDQKKVSKVILEPDYYTNQFKNKIDKLYGGNIILIGEYKNRNTKTILSCKEHGNEIIVSPEDLPK